MSPTAAKSQEFRNLVSSENSQPFRRALVVVEKKLKFLEQKKARIEAYAEAQRGGRQLTGGQESALARLGQVTRMLGDLREVHGQLCSIAQASHAPELPGSSRGPDGTQQDLAKIRDVLMIQYVLQNMRQDKVREDFLTGQNGAICLTESDLECLDEFYVEISLMNDTEDDVPSFQDQLQQSAEHLLALVNGKAKEINGTTYAKLKELIVAIQTCGYFDYIVEELATHPIFQNTLKEETLVVEEFEVANGDIEADDYSIQDQGTFVQGIPSSYGCVNGAETSMALSTHSSDDLFTCSNCPAKFSKRFLLRRHMRSHSSKRSECCTVCNTTFSGAKHLESHMLDHASERPFVCAKCNVGYRRKDHLKRHIMTHGNKKAFPCSMCKARFTRQKALQSHMRKHSDRKFCCSVCDGKFFEDDDLKKHMLCHTPKKTFPCSVCSMEFADNMTLKKHVPEHSSTTFSCPACRAKFSLKSQLSEHILSHL
ncbi:zinc finger protein 391-like [Bacillus rossius redtenbacheri]|uniref:zinc finger protein 391-like n=1 Tax=Bacillus rossius redtenbacheri TaxID=93214 RepID=UPI002FDE0836